MSLYQHGFLPQRSCSTQLITAINHWTESLQQGYHTNVIYFDFHKAFDTVPHLRLLHKLEAHGISGKLLKWIKLFFTCRKQRVVINGQYSPWSSVRSGVPQGSVLGPLLFAIYVNDLPDNVKSFLLLFADDTKLYHTIRSCSDVQQLQEDIDALYQWTRL